MNEILKIGPQSKKVMPKLSVIYQYIANLRCVIVLPVPWRACSNVVVDAEAVMQ